METINRTYGKLQVSIFENRDLMGKAAAEKAAAIIKDAIAKRGEANVVFAAAPSQNDLLLHLLESDVDWSKVRAFHQDEYIGISADEPAGFGNFLRRAIFDKVKFMEYHYLLCSKEEAEKKCEEYSALLHQHPVDLILLGVGENGHLAFNDPAYADFADPKTVKTVKLDNVCRQQQVNDGCFATLADVPEYAMTVSMSYIRSVANAICVVPTDRKANAIKNALTGPITTACPASIMREMGNCSLYLDRDSAKFVL